MGKPSATGKIAIKGTRANDTITVGETSVTVNGGTKYYSPEQVSAGFLLKGDAGHDTISGGGGPDEIDGGDGNDSLTGGGGADKLLGGAGNDLLVGTMDDQFNGGRGIDTLDLSGSPVAVGVDLSGYGAFFPDISVTDANGDGYLEVGLGDELAGVARDLEHIIGSSYNDFLFGNQLENIIRGGAGDDAISAGHDSAYADKLFGDAGNDEMYAGGGNDELTGGTGADTFSFDPAGKDGNWIIHDYSSSEGDKVRLFPYDGDISWSEVTYQGIPSLQATLADGDTITFVAITNSLEIDIAATMAWPGP